MFLAVLSSILPDADVIGFNFGVPYEHWLGHRGFTHSILFAVLWALILSVVFGKKQQKVFFVIIFFTTLSHAVVDAMTSGGKGVGFFIPFNNTRYFFDYRPIKVSPIGISNFFSEWGYQVILSELLWIGLPCMVFLIILKMIHQWTSKTHK